MDEENGCCDGGVVESIPDVKPPCSQDSCSWVWSKLRDTGGRLSGMVRLRGDQTVDVGVDCQDPDECGVIACYENNGDPLGLDVRLYGDPATLEEIDCLDDEGNNLYSNPLRKIRNPDGSCGLGVLPFPVQDKVCVEEDACESFLGEGQEGDVFSGCAKSVCVSITNPSCFPIVVTPSVTIQGAELGAAPVTYEVQPNINGQFDSKFPIFSSIGECSMNAAGTGETSSSGDPAHTHEGPSHSHNLDCGEARSTYSGTVNSLPVEVQPNESFSYCITPSIRYDGDVGGNVQYNYGQIIVCLDYASKVTPETIAALEGA